MLRGAASQGCGKPWQGNAHGNEAPCSQQGKTHHDTAGDVGTGLERKNEKSNGADRPQPDDKHVPQGSPAGHAAKGLCPLYAVNGNDVKDGRKKSGGPERTCEACALSQYRMIRNICRKAAQDYAEPLAGPQPQHPMR